MRDARGVREQGVSMKTAMKREITRIKGDRYCAVTIEIREGGELSVCGESGRVVRTVQAKREALEYWRSFFDDSPDEIRTMNAKCGTHFRGSLSAAKYVLRVDGDFHGLDVRENDAPRGYVLVGESFGQCVGEIRAFFPEVEPLLPWHLNNMKAGCVHQEAEGWDKRPIDPSKPTDTYGKHFPGQSSASWNMLTWVRRDEHPQGLLCEPCPVCGYRYGSAWQKRELPPEIVTLAETVCASEERAA
jgi:hypothetical protein